MIIENTILKTHDFKHAEANRKANQEKTGNKTFIKHLGPNNSHSEINYQDYLVVEVVSIDEKGAV